MIHEIPKDELSTLIRDWYYSASEGKMDQFLSFFAQDERAVYFGTDPDEQWYGSEQIRSFFEDLFRTYGKWTIMSKKLVVQQLGEGAIFSDEVELSARYGESSIAQDARMTGALIRQNGQWKVIQAHFSFGVPNSELLPG
jgi:ketosteroid isomerase-like protein